MRRIEVTAGVVRRDDRILIARRAPHESMPGMWEFPGGTVEDGESIAECMTRELMEETRLTVALSRALGRTIDRRPDLEISLHFFELDYVSGSVELVDHDLHAWVGLTQLSDYAFPPADVPVIALWREAGAVVPWDGVLQAER